MVNMKKLRKAKKLTQKELGELVGISEAQINLIENGKRSPSFETLLKIAEALDCEMADLVSKRENIAPEDNKKTATNNGDGLTDVQKEFLSVFYSLTDQDVSVLLSAAKAQLEAHKYQGD